ncbi:unnamed protein product [Trifolium pratense]|uniref:Uncharacterized protein n=1 Tax=Trifolium pratense TaxID=57577 RepID=A0ACB0M190_TRIPR|nr:unnamed protein product [Trifolium pratense]
MKNLEILDISCCEMIENIVVWSKDDKEDENVPTIGFGKLYHLSLSKLPKLVNICSDSVELECQSLREFKISGCPMLAISLLSSHIHANQDNLNVTSQDDNLGSFKVNNSSSSTSGHVGCTSFLPKFIRQRTTKKKINKEASMTQAPEDHIPSIFEMKTKKVKTDMPALEEKFNFLVSPHLKTITIEECDKLKTITVGREKREEMMNIFTQLESLHLISLPNLESFNLSGTYDSFDKQQDKDECVGDHQRIRCHPFMDEPLFPNLTSLIVLACNKIRILFSRSSLDSLEHLEELEVRNCKNMQEIVSQEELEASSNKITLLRLKHLILWHLPNLKAFCLSSYNLFFPSLQKVKIYDCLNMEVFSQGFSNTPKLEDFSMRTKSLNRKFMHTRDINATIRGFKAFVASQASTMLNWTMLHNEGYFFRNSTIDIHSFHELSFLVPFNEIKMLQHVTEFNVTNCDSLVEVFESGGCRREADDTTHYQLQYMRLENLPKLSQIWKIDITEIVNFQKLTNIEVSRCDNLKSLFSHSMTRGLVQLQNLVVSRCKTMEAIINKEDEYIEGGNKVKTLFPKLQGLTFECLPNLECVCSGNYDYDLPLGTIGEDNEINNNKIQISFPELMELVILDVPKLRCFCSGTYDYDIMVSSTEEYLNMGTFPHGNVIVNTPNLHKVGWNGDDVHTFGDLNLTIYYIQNSEKFMIVLGKLETFRDINEELVNYTKRVKQLVIKNNHKLLNFIPSDMMHIFSDLEDLFMENCECVEEIFESNDGGMLHRLLYIYLSSLPKLKHLWKNHGHSLAYQKLTFIAIKQCHDLKYVFPNVSIATSLPNLSFIGVYECEKMEEIIGNNFNPINCVQAQPQKAKIIFPSLWRIELQKLPHLKYFCRSAFSSYVELPILGLMKIEECLEMKTFWYNGILYTPINPTISMDNTRFDNGADANEVIQQYSKLQ